MTTQFKNYINGNWIDASSGKTFKNINPANTNDVIGIFPDSGKADVDNAVKAAVSAYDKWRLTPAPKRGEIISRAGELLVEHKGEIAKLMTREMGKILKETKGDVQEGIDTAIYTAGEGRRLFGETTPSELPNKFCMSVRAPVGVCGIITPWNFPIAIPTWKIFPALLCGNTVVFKPAHDTPASAVKFAEILEQAGVPHGVVNLVHGSGKNVGNPIVQHPDIDLISFTGSSVVGKEIASLGGADLKRVSLELGGKNAQIVMDDADLDLAVEGALWGAFGTTGQRCTATSRLILHKKITEKFMDKLISRAKNIKIGNGLNSDTEMGPLINESQRERVHNYIDIGKEEGAEVILGGSFYEEGNCKKGFFYNPTIFTKVKPDMRIAQEEIFGPVVVIIEVTSFEESIKVLNNTRYGLSSSIYTNDVNQAFKAIRDIEAGITYINGPTIGAEVHLPFGGMKDTGNGHREAGKTVLDIFSEWKAAYIDYSGKLQKAQIDT
tara:strand:- start:1632 stop:3116 length:1485 start_codon:yes stop_codon:yes gene_type:complete